jgi:hypothetical protein
MHDLRRWLSVGGHGCGAIDRRIEPEIAHDLGSSLSNIEQSDTLDGSNQA